MKQIHLLIGFLIIIAFAISILLSMMYKRVEVEGIDAFEVVPGATASEVAKKLKEQNVISSERLFNVWAKLKGIDKELQAGQYKFPEGKFNMLEVVEFLTHHARAKEIWFTVPEGSSISQIDSILLGKGLLQDRELIDYSQQKFSIFNFQFSNMEGFLFPDTYRVYQEATVEDIVQKMLKNFEKKTVSLVSEIDKQEKDLYDIIILASILEREVRTAEDMATVSDILWRRLDAGMLLQVDSTLNYILPGQDQRASLTYDQLEIDSKYNTYKYGGLPPTPIGNPGINAIRSAVYPKANEYWFYLSNQDTGETVFSRTYEEHLTNKNKYLK